MSILTLNNLLRTDGTGNTDNADTTTPSAQPNFATPSLSSAAMMVELSISVWTGRKKDKQATADVTATNQAKTGVAAVNKKLMADCAELDAIQKFAASVRTFHYSATLPWTTRAYASCPRRNTSPTTGRSRTCKTSLTGW